MASVTLTSNGDTVLSGSFGSADTITGTSGINNVTMGSLLNGTVVNLLDGNDTLKLFDGTNSVSVRQVESIVGGTGNDAVTLLDAWNSANVINLGSGFDRLTLANANNTVIVEQIESVFGGTADDVVTLNTQQNTGFVNLGLGNDVLNIADGTNTISGQANFVTVAGAEVVNGGTGNDFISLSANAITTVDLDAGADRLTLLGGNNTITATNVESIIGGGGNDSVKITNSLTAGAIVNLGGGYDAVTLDGAGNTASIAAETIIGSTGNDVITLLGVATSWRVDLGAGTADRLNVGGANATNNTVTVAGAESVFGAGSTTANDIIFFQDAVTNSTFINLGAGNDRIVLTSTVAGAGGNGFANDVSVFGNQESVLGAAGDDRVTLAAGSTAGQIVSGPPQVVTPAHYLLGAGTDTVILLGNNDTVSLSGVEILDAGGGNDSITVIAGIPAGNASITASSYDLGAGNDVLNLTGASTLDVLGAETINGSGSGDFITVDGAAALIDLNGGADRVTLTAAGSVTLTEVETVIGSAGDNIVTLGDAVNTIRVTGIETLTGNVKQDIVTLGEAVSGMTIDLLGQSTVASAGDKVVLFGTSTATNTLNLANVESVVGSAGADNVTVTTAASGVTAGTGARFDLGGGTDVLTLSALDDLAIVTGVEVINGGLGNDQVTLGGAGSVSLTSVEAVTGSTGNDVLTFTSAATATLNLGLGSDRVNLGTGTNNITISGVETVDGSAGNTDTVNLTGTNNVVLIGIETVNAGAGNDGVTLTTAAVNAAFDLGDGNDRLTLANFNNSVTVNNIEVVNGGGSADIINGAGSAVAMVLRGNGGNDELIGGASRDQIRGGLGADVMTGNDGSDVFIFASTEAAGDTITDFNGGNDADFETDLLMFTGLLRGEFTYLGAVAKFEVTGSSQARMVGAVLEVDSDGNGASNFSITLTGNTAASITQSDFLWI